MQREKANCRNMFGLPSATSPTQPITIVPAANVAADAGLDSVFPRPDSPDVPAQQLTELHRLRSLVHQQADKINNQYKEIQRLKKKIQKSKSNKPKHTTSSFLYFSSHRRPFLMQEHPEYDFQDVGRVLGQEWRNLTQQAKRPYLAQGAADKIRYLTQMRSEGCTQDEAQNGMQDGSKSESHGGSGMQEDKQQGHARTRRKSGSRYAAGLPKRSKSAYLYYAQQRRSQLQLEHPQWNFTDLARNLGKEWQSMDMSSRAPFVRLNALDKERYLKQIVRFRNGEKFDRGTITNVGNVGNVGDVGNVGNVGNVTV